MAYLCKLQQRVLRIVQRKIPPLVVILYVKLTYSIAMFLHFYSNCNNNIRWLVTPAYYFVNDTHLLQYKNLIQLKYR